MCKLSLARALPIALFAASFSRAQADNDSAKTPQKPRIFAAEPRLLADGFRFTEGPLWYQGNSWLFSDIPANTIYRVTTEGEKSVFREDSRQANGLTLDRQGRLVACEHQARRVTLTQMNGSIRILVDRFNGKRLNSPNDAAVRSDGTIFFTDPTYGLRKRPPELPCKGVYRVAPDGKTCLLADDFNMPNGIAFSPDETVLYVADTAENHVRRFNVSPDGMLSGTDTFCEVPNPDGMKVDTLGRLFVASRDGIAVFAPDGAALTLLQIPRQPTNCAFGGPDGKTLCVTARNAVYTVRLEIPGIIPASDAR